MNTLGQQNGSTDEPISGNARSGPHRGRESGAGQMKRNSGGLLPAAPLSAKQLRNLGNPRSEKGELPRPARHFAT